MNEISTTVALSLTVKSASDALDFYTRAFGAEELVRMPTPEGGVGHAEFMIGNTKLYISDEDPEWHAYAMPEGTSASCLFAIATDDCDAAFAKAVEAGGEVLSEPTDHFWGMRSAMVKDPYGYRWSLGQITEELTAEEVAQRAQEIYG